MSLHHHDQLDRGTRALLRLVAPDAPEPLTAPAWIRWLPSEPYGNRWWRLGCGRDAVTFGFGPLGGGAQFVFGEAEDTDDPLRALALALDWAAKGKP